MTHSIDDAIILAAGNGDRFRNGSSHSKLITPIANVPLLTRTLTSTRRAGIAHAHVVLGYDADYVRALALSDAPSGLTLHFHVNHAWHEENGRSVLQARAALRGRPFAILMGDHIFEPEALQALARTRRRPGETLVGIDRYTTDPEIVGEATKVRMDDDDDDNDRITAIGKTVDPFDGLDTGLFVSDASVFAAIEEACADGDTTLSGGIARLASRRLVRGIDIGLAKWCDVDTIGDLTMAEELSDPVPAT
jgi:1L-myo-inositol 1-phosphate cytidylyltransferase